MFKNWRVKLFRWLLKDDVVIKDITDKIEEKLRNEIDLKIKNRLKDLQNDFLKKYSELNEMNKNNNAYIMNNVMNFKDEVLAGNEDLKKKLSEYVESATNTSKLVDNVILHEKFINNIKNQLRSEIELDSYTFNKKMELSRLRAGLPYKEVADNFRSMIKDVTQKYLLSTYGRSYDSTGLNPLVHYDKASEIEDVNKIYELFLSVANTGYLDQLSLYFDLKDLFSKEFIGSTYIYPIYKPLIDDIRTQAKIKIDEVRNSGVEIPPLPVEEEEPEEVVELKNTIDDIFNKM